MISQTPKPPYYAVIFTSIKRKDIVSISSEDYSSIAKRMEELVVQQPGYLGHESAREEIGITVSYWKDLASIKQWKENAEHLFAQQKGIALWYSYYKTRICLVERDYEFNLL